MCLHFQFESSVILEGSKTGVNEFATLPAFESSVILEGSKTITGVKTPRHSFESSVILEGSKTMCYRLSGRS